MQQFPHQLQRKLRTLLIFKAAFSVNEDYAVSELADRDRLSLRVYCRNTGSKLPSSHSIGIALMNDGSTALSRPESPEFPPEMRNGGELRGRGRGFVPSVLAGGVFGRLTA